jgi:hypothetical protein
MTRLRHAMIPGAVLLVCALLLAGCSDHGAGSQPPASTRTLAPTPVKPTAVRTTVAPPTVTPPEPTASPRPGTISQGGSSLQVTGPVLGFRGTGGSYLDLITLDLAKSPSVDPVDMDHLQVTLTLHDETTALRYEIRAQRNGDRDTLLENGETFSLAVPVMPNYWIYRNEPFELRILVPGSGPVLIRSRGPAVVEEQNLLAEP